MPGPSPQRINRQAGRLADGTIPAGKLIGRFRRATNRQFNTKKAGEAFCALLPTVHPLCS